LGAIFCQDYMQWISNGRIPTFQAKQRQRASKDYVVFWQKWWKTCYWYGNTNGVGGGGFCCFSRWTDQGT